MKKYVMVVLASAFVFNLAVSAQDQTPPTKGERGPKREMHQGDRPQMTPQMRAERLAKQVNLTDAEKAKVQALYEKQEANRIKEQAKNQKTREEMKAQFDTERKAQDAELEKIIGTEKFQKLQTIRAERQEKMKQRMEKEPKQEPVEIK